MPDTASAKVFPGNVDSTSLVKNQLNNTVDARYVRFVVQSWHEYIAMRVEILGCNTNPSASVSLSACPQPLGMASGAIPDYSITASSAAGPGFAPYFGRLNGNTGGGGWAAGVNVIGEWLQVFLGNFDATYPATNPLYNPVDARYVRFVVQSWHDHIAMRVEILGCNTNPSAAVSLSTCPQPLGMESGAIPDYSITASSAAGPGFAPYFGRLNGNTGGGGWAARVNVIGEWLQVFLGNFDANYPATNPLYNPVDARYVRFVVQSWYRHIAMRVEILGYDTTGFPGVCVDPPTQANTTGSVCDCPYLPGENCTYPCSPGYHVISGDVITRTCTTDGSWTEPDVFCESCGNPLGMESGAITDGSITASSFLRAGYEPYRGRLDGVVGGGAWVAKYPVIGQWLQVFPGNVDRSHPVTNQLDNAVDARYFRFLPQSWHNHIAMRVELFGYNTNAVLPSCPRLLGMESGTILDDSITASSTLGDIFKSYYGRLNGVAGAGAWLAKYTTVGQWLQVFPGNFDRTYPVINLLDNPVDARSVRFVVQSWHNHIAMRVEIVGCNTIAAPFPSCPHLLGMESGAIPDGSITASSFHSAGYEPYNGRLNGIDGEGAWVARHDTIGEWLQVNLGEKKPIMGTIIQGRHSENQWVTSYKLQYSTYGTSWVTYASNNGSDMVFPGNADRSLPVTNLLNNPVDARYVRFVPQTWHGHIAMRLEIVGCNTTFCLTTKHVENGALNWDLPKITSSPFIFEVKVNSSGSGSVLIFLYPWDDDTTENQEAFRVELTSGQSLIVRTTKDGARDTVASYHSTGNVVC
ncbi:uncharacterized protein LOC144877167 [Branchiostoma floridae x Branchiostoma japonicum]